MKFRVIRPLALVVAVAIFAMPAARAADAPQDAALAAAIAGKQRAEANSSRDGARHPYQTLAFWGLKPRQSVIEIEPGGGYWTEILAAYAKATGGSYGGTMPDTTAPDFPERARQFIADYKAKIASEPAFVKVNWITYGEKGGALGPPGSADMVITARNIHDWMWEPGQLDKILSDFYAVLKPGGILAVEDHRADPRAQVPDAHDGYVNTKFLVAAVEKAGFKLEATSEINANPKDTKDYPFGVWTLPPTNAREAPPYLIPWPNEPAAATLRDASFYQAIGESDRMTLRFRKPG